MLDAGNVRPNGGPGRESAAHYAACAGILNAGLRCISQPVAQTPAKAPAPEDLGLSSDKYPIYGGRVGLRALCATG
jgi:hypothetical protein